MSRYHLLLIIAFLYSGSLNAQSSPPDNWYNLDWQTDGVPGVSTERTYSELLQEKDGKAIIVAIIDSGVDAEHEDLAEVMWVNPGEIPNNNIDDDNNGYVDDINGWNFIGGEDGSNVHHDSYEVTRLYGKYHYKYAQADRDKLTKNQKKEYDEYLGYKKVVEGEREKAQKNLDKIMQTKSMLYAAIDALEKATKDKPLSKSLIDSLDALGTSELRIGISVYREAAAAGEEMKSVMEMRELLQEELQGALDYYGNKVDYSYNPDYNPRLIVGDNYEDVSERNYGNNDVEGPDAMHGTHVAGAVAAVRNNGIGMKGVADHVAIMSVRTVPDGDERDKDVANAIRYAVDNGASIINMSFGKGQTWNKQIVDEAVQYAIKNDVLLVHASGNSHQNNDIDANFPNDTYEKKGLICKKKAKNWIEVGALSFKEGEEMVASFSNYGKKEVDLFSPGVAIYSTLPNNEYGNLQGTSMASPIVAGVASVLRSYYPSLTAAQVKDIILNSVVPIPIPVKIPGQNKVVPATEISVSGGIVNLYKAVQLAEVTKGKAKKKSKIGSKWRSYDTQWKDKEDRKNRA